MKTIALGMFALAGLVSLVGCATEAEDTAALSDDSQTVKGADSGTYLSATAYAGAPLCLPDGNASVSIEGILTSQASSAWADVTINVDGAGAQSIDEVLPTDFSKGGRVKTYDYAYDVILAEGAHTVEICFIQPSGQLRMTACATVEVSVDCDQQIPSTCPQQGPFGDTIGNKNLCHGQHDNNVEVQVKGDFGDDATLTVSGPNGFGFTVPMPHSGNSCVYHYNWDTRDNNGGIGLYTYTVTGAGSTETWTAKLFCL